MSVSKYSAYSCDHPLNNIKLWLGIEGLRIRELIVAQVQVVHFLQLGYTISWQLGQSSVRQAHVTSHGGSGAWTSYLAQIKYRSHIFLHSQ